MDVPSVLVPSIISYPGIVGAALEPFPPEVLRPGAAALASSMVSIPSGEHQSPGGRLAFDGAVPLRGCRELRQRRGIDDEAMAPVVGCIPNC